MILFYKKKTKNLQRIKQKTLNIKTNENKKTTYHSFKNMKHLHWNTNYKTLDLFVKTNTY